MSEKLLFLTVNGGLGFLFMVIGFLFSPNNLPNLYVRQIAVFNFEQYYIALTILFPVLAEMFNTGLKCVERDMPDCEHRYSTQSRTEFGSGLSGARNRVYTAGAPG